MKIGKYNFNNDALLSYAGGILFGLLGAYILITMPQPVNGTLVPYTPVNNTITMPTATIAPITVTPANVHVQEHTGVSSELFTGIMMMLLGLFALFLGEYITLKSNYKQAKQYIAGLEAKKAGSNVDQTQESK